MYAKQVSAWARPWVLLTVSRKLVNRAGSPSGHISSHPNAAASSRWEKYCPEVHQLDFLQLHSPHPYKWMPRVQVTNHVMCDEKQKIFLMFFFFFFFFQKKAQNPQWQMQDFLLTLYFLKLCFVVPPSFDTSILVIRSTRKSASKPDNMCFRPSMETCPGPTRAHSKQAEQTGLLYVGSIRQ